ncbi:MAG: phage tail sheath C-terminal domain-containing protein [Anaerolineales bacterium]
MPAYQTPGVYYERVDASPPGIAAIRTDITGFAGIARRGPLHAAVPVQSWRQFQSYFGDFTGAGYLAYAVRAFFENGGRRCWVVRVASDIAATATMTLKDTTSQNTWRIEAFSPGVWGNDLDITLKETHRAQASSDPTQSAPEYSRVSSITGFGRSTLVRLTQGTTVKWKVVSDVDAVDHRLLWLHPKPENRLPYDEPLTGFDPNNPIFIESVEYTLLVWESGRLIQIYEGLTLLPEHDRYGPRVLAKLEIPKNTGLARTLPAAPGPIVIAEMRDPDAPSPSWLKPLLIDPGRTIPLTGGADGLALLSVYDFIGEEVSPLDSDELKQQKLRGLRALEEIDEVAIVAIPDIHIQPLAIPPKAPLPPCVPDSCLPPGPPSPAIPRETAVGDLPPVFSEQEIFRMQSALIQQCEKRRDRIALLDPPFAAARDDALGVGAVRAWRSRFDSKYAAFYYPWLRVVDPLRPSAALTRDIPPSGHVAGQYAQTDFQAGVHKAPANAPLVWTQDVTVMVGDAIHGILNPAGINVIRPLTGRGIRIFGARTATSDQDWRFVNVRRLLMMIEKAIYVSTQWAVFEPNDIFTRAKLHLSLTSFLLSLWQQGALMGASANEAFFVKCDEENNPETERGNGRLLAEVGVAPSQPFEFVILRVGRTGNEFEISEAARALSLGGMF